MHFHHVQMASHHGPTWQANHAHHLLHHEMAREAEETVDRERRSQTILTWIRTFLATAAVALHGATPAILIDDRWIATIVTRWTEMTGTREEEEMVGMIDRRLDSIMMIPDLLSGGREAGVPRGGRGSETAICIDDNNHGMLDMGMVCGTQREPSFHPLWRVLSHLTSTRFCKALMVIFSGLDRRSCTRLIALTDTTERALL
jgi:hypothetical protein